MDDIVRKQLAVGAVVGAVTASIGLLLSALFLWVTGHGPVGQTPPFTTLTTDGVDPLTAATWTWFDASGAHPLVHWDNVYVYRSVLDDLDGTADQYRFLRVVPPILVTLAGATTGLLARHRLSGFSSHRSDPALGASLTLGYAPVLLVAYWWSRAPVAPNASGEVRIGSTATNASELAGVTAGPPLLFVVVIAVGYPVVFGVLGMASSQVLAASRE